MGKTKEPVWKWAARLQLLRVAAEPPISLNVLGSAMVRSIKRTETEAPSFPEPNIYTARLISV